MKKRSKNIGVILSIILLTLSFTTGCDSNKVEAPTVKVESTTKGMTFNEVKNSVDNALKDIKLEKNDLIKSYSTKGDEAEYTVSIVLNEETVKSLIDNQNNDAVIEAWNSIIKSYQEMTETTKKHFRDNEYATTVIFEVLNGYDTERTLLEIVNGEVTYNFMENQE